MRVDMLPHSAHGYVPEFGAIFMSNSMTRKECLRRRLFGLPYRLGNFVKQIKAGMILFLFEHESRLLHGVFQARSDGEMNIVPDAYSSFGKQFPAQVRFSIMWRCCPLSEDLFQNAIKENYFSPKKFNFGLSKEQVHMLLSLFSLTKFNDQLHLRQLSRGSLECSRDYAADDNKFMLSGRSKGKQKVCEDQANTMRESVPMPYSPGNKISSSERLIYHSYMDPAYSSDLQSNAQIRNPSIYNQSDYMPSMPFQSTVYSEKIISEPSETHHQENLSRSEPDLRSFPRQEFENDGSLSITDASQYQPSLYSPTKYMISMPFQTAVYSESITTIPSETHGQVNLSCSERSSHSLLPREFENDGSLRFINASQYQPSLYGQSDSMSSMPFQMAESYSGNIGSMPSETQCQVNVSCSEPNLHSLPTREFENNGRLSFVNASQYSFHDLNYNHPSAFPNQDEQNIARLNDTEAYHIFDSVKISSLPPKEQTSATYEPEYYGNSGSLQSDHGGRNRQSVFSRLAYPSDASIQEFDDYEKRCFDLSVDEVLSVLQQSHQQMEKTNYEMPNQGHKYGRNWMEKKQTKSSSSLYTNSIEISDEIRTTTEEDMAGNSNPIDIETPFVNFKRRKTSKTEDVTPSGGPDMKIISDPLSGGQQKRRKLIRPSFVKNKSCDRGDINSTISSDLKDPLEESQVSGERPHNDPSIEIKEMEKLPENAELPEFIPLISSEDQSNGSGSVETKICCGSPRSGSKDGEESSNCTEQNLNDSCLSNQQEVSLERSEVNAGNSVTKVDDNKNKCNEKEFVKSPTKAGEEPYQGTYGSVLENKTLPSGPRYSAYKRIPEEPIDGSKHNNEQWIQKNRAII